MSKLSILRDHVQRYIRETVAERLHEQGFVSKGNDDIHWYRVINGEVVHAIYFFTEYNALPALMEIGYGCHPLYITPQFPASPYMQYKPGNEVLYPRYVLMAQHNNICYSEDILVTCPEDETVVDDILTKIFDTLDLAVSPRDCYDLHKAWRRGEIEYNSVIAVSTHFVDEVVFWQDEELYPYCKEFLAHRERLLREAYEKGKLPKRFISELDYLQILKQSVLDRKRDEHMQILEERRNHTVKLLKKHCGIRI